MASAAAMVLALPVVIRSWAGGSAQRFVDIANLAGAEESVGVEVAAVVAGEGFGQ